MARLARRNQGHGFRAVIGGKGHYLVVLTLADTDNRLQLLSAHGGDRQEFLEIPAALTAKVLIPICICAGSAWRSDQMMRARPRKCSAGWKRRSRNATAPNAPRELPLFRYDLRATQERQER